MYTPFKGTITVAGHRGAGAAAEQKPRAGEDRNKKPVTLRSCALFTDCISETYNVQKDLDVVISMYKFFEYSANYSKTSGKLRHYCRVAQNNPITDSKSRLKLTGNTNADGTRDLEVTIPLKYLCKLWRFIEMLFINCEINCFGL